MAQTHPARQPQYPRHATERLANGLLTAIVEAPDTHQVLVTLLVRVGSRYESAEEAGISHFLEHMLFRGNEGFADADALNRAFEGVGSMLAAHTGVEGTGFEFTAHPERLGEALEHLSIFLQTPSFADVEKERGILLDELAYDYNDQGLLIHLPALVSEMFWPGHPIGRIVGGRPDTVAAITAAQVRGHHRRYYRPENLVLGLVGNLTAAEGFSLARRHFEDWRPAPLSVAATPPPPSPAPPTDGQGPHLKTVPDADNQFHLLLAFPAPSYNDPQEIAMTLLGRMLDDGPTSRLQRIIREEKGLVYHIAGSYSGYWDAGTYDLATSVKSDGLEELFRSLLAELAAFRSGAGGATRDEFERARMRHLFELEFARDSLAAKTDRYVWPLLNSSVRSEEEEMDLLRAVPLEQVRELAARLLTPQNLHLAVVGPMERETEKVLRSALENF